MKHFKNLFTWTSVAFFLINISVSNAQYNLGFDYKFHKTIYSKQSYKVLDQYIDSPWNGNIYAGRHHGRDNQKWIIMPLYIKVKQGDVRVSNEYIIASKYNGKVADIALEKGNLYCNPYFHGGDNQIFKFNYSGSGTEIASLYNSNKVLDLTLLNGNSNPWDAPTGNTGNVYFGNYHGKINQQFSISTNLSDPLPNAISSLRYARELQVPKPPVPTSFTSQMPLQTTKTFVSETLIPFPLVKNDLPISAQAKRSPYYRLVRSQYYELLSVDADIRYIKGQSLSKTITVKTGIKESLGREVFKKLNVGFTASAEVTGTFGKIITGKAKSSISKAFELSEKTTSNIETTYEKTETITTGFDFDGDVRVLHYVLIDSYTLFRSDGTEVLSWDIKTKTKHTTTFPVAVVSGSKTGSKFEIANPSSRTQRKLNKGDINSFNSKITQDSNSALLEFTAHPNPASNEIHLNVSQVIEQNKAAYVTFHDLSGREVLRKPITTKLTILNTTKLNRGIYIMSLYSDNNRVYKKITIDR